MGEYGKINIIVRKINPVYSIVSNDIVYRLRLQVRRCIGMSKMMYAVLSCMGVLVLIICDIQCIKTQNGIRQACCRIIINRCVISSRIYDHIFIF